VGGRPADVFAEYRVDEQLMKALDRKVYLPSGGSLVIDRTEAMTVVDVNTGKFTGPGGNLEQTVTRNNIEAAEEIVRQLRLRDIGGIIVIDFIDMVLESNRDLVLRRLVECLGRDRTKHQVAEVTSLGLVQMTRKRIGCGPDRGPSPSPCEHCNGRGLLVRDEPVERTSADSGNGGSSGNSGSSGGASGGGGGGGSAGRGRGRRSRGGAGGQNAQDQGAQHANAGNGDNAGHPGNTGHAGTGGSGGAASGPTPAQIAAQAYAAALHAAGHDADHSADHAAHHSSDRAPEQADEAPLPSSITGPDAEPDADVVEPSGGPGYPAPRARRKRGRVVAPAGPPRSQDDDGGDATPQSAASPEPAVSPEPAEPAEPTESPA
jgi:ribonuclease E